MNDPFAELRDDLLRCNKCGSCAAVCPTYGALRRETASARGRVSLIAAYLAGEVEATAEFEDLLYYCLSCRACAATCPNGVRVDRLVLAARAALTARDGKSRVRRVIFDSLLPYPGRSRCCHVANASLPGVRSARACRSHRSGRSPSRQAIDVRADAAALPCAPGEARCGRPFARPGPRRGRVGYFLGCAQNLAYPETARATVALLNLAGFDVITPPDTACCGMPAHAYGEVDVAADWPSATSPPSPARRWMQW